MIRGVDGNVYAAEPHFLSRWKAVCSQTFARPPNPFPLWPEHAGNSYSPESFPRFSGMCGNPNRFNKNRYTKNAVNNKKEKIKLQPSFIDYCDVCDRGFTNQNKKDQHYREHTKCDMAGCSFEAHFKIVSMHKKNVHGPNGIKIKLETEEDIRKWREARKRNYPTAENVKRKEKEVLSKFASGNVLSNKSFGKCRSNKRFKQGRRNAKPYKVNDGREQKQSKNCIAAMRTRYKSTSDAKNLLESDSFLESDSTAEDDVDTKSKNPQSREVKVTNALSSLIDSYASDSEDQSVDKEITVPEKFYDDYVIEADVGVVTPTNYKEDSAEFKSIDDLFVKDLQETETTKNQGKEMPPIKEESNKQNGKQNNSKRRPTIKARRPTLIEMLLAPDIRRERNIILQCVRYITRHNFFDAIEQ